MMKSVARMFTVDVMQETKQQQQKNQVLGETRNVIPTTTALIFILLLYLVKKQQAYLNDRQAKKFEFHIITATKIRFEV